jgi:N-acetylglucosaminyl-diphospho-decaprenol L-rhamnosyltransferase
LPAIILNNDISFDDNLVGGLLASLRDHPRAGLIGPRVFFPDGRFQLSWGDDLSVFSEWREWRRQAQMRRGNGALYGTRMKQSVTPRRVDWISGVAFLVTPDTLQAIGGLDAGYYFYFEDCDWSRRSRQAGKEVWFDPRVTVRHALGAARPAPGKHPDALRFYRSRQLGRLRYYDRFSSWFQFQGIRAVIAMRAFARGDLEMLAELCRRGRGRARGLPTEWKQSEAKAALDSGKSELV